MPWVLIGPNKQYMPPLWRINMDTTIEHEISQRVSAMQPSATLAMTARAKALKATGRPIIGLSAGEPDFDTPAPIAAAAVQAIHDGFTHYTDNAGVLALREAISRKLQSDNRLSFSPDEIICSNGAKQSVAMAISVLCRPGDEVLIPVPYWVSYPEMARFADAVPVTIPTGVEAGYRLTPERLEAAITPQSRVLVLCSPSNPTGAAYSAEAMEGLAAVLRRHPHVYVVSDEIYEHIRYGVDHVSIGALEGMRNRTITVNGFSKAYAMTGWRLGYMAADRPIVKAVSKLQSQFTSAPSSISQKAGIAALAMDSGPIDSMVQAFRYRRDFVLEALRALPGITCPTPEGAFYVFPAIRALYGRTTPSGRVIDSSESFCFYLLEEHDVALVPGHAFGDDDGIRISYAASMENLAEAMRRIAVAVNSLN
jgi:aspartate/methionine/tyrosine aminotransferase